MLIQHPKKLTPKRHLFKSHRTLRTQILFDHSRLNSQYNWGDLYDYSIRTKICTWVGNEKDIHTSSKNSEESGYRYDLDFVNHLALIVCFVSYMQWVKREKFLFKAHSPYWNTLTCSNNCSERSPSTWRYTIYDPPLREKSMKDCSDDIIHDGILSAAHN